MTVDRRTETFPALPYESWKPTLATVHRFVQVVGKIRLAASPRRNHWWNVPLHLTGRGLTTRPMGRSPFFAIDFDFVAHRLEVTSEHGGRHSFALEGQSVGSFVTELDEALRAIGVEARAAELRPFDLPDAARLFKDDVEHDTYDPAAVRRYWQILGQVNLVLEEFAGRWSGKTSPVHHFWHTFDITVTRFSDRDVDHALTVDPVTREAYSREVMSFGFWFGDESNPAPAFYAYVAPEPAGLVEEPLAPATSRWVERGASHLALLAYDDARLSDDPVETVLAFYESAFQAGAARAGWDLSREQSVGGATDPHARRTFAGHPDPA